MLIRLLCFSISLLVSQPETRPHFIGQWDHAVTTDREDPDGHGGEIHHRWEFRADGTFAATVGLECQTTYKVEGHHLLTIDSSSKLPVEDQEFRIEGNVLILKLDGEETRLKRLDPLSIGTADIVGRWGDKGDFFHQGPNGLFEIAFTEDGRMTIKMQSQPMDGRYKISNRLLIAVDRTGTTKYRFRFENGFLFLKSLDEESTGETRHKRVR